MNEIWKDVPGYEGIYQVSSLGNVKSLGNDRTRKEKILKKTINENGYFHLRLPGKMCRVHQLVAMAFLNHIPDGHKLVVDHIDGNRLNNSLNNLQIITQRENLSKDKKNKTSKYTGVSWDKSSGKYKVAIFYNGKSVHLGYFKCELSAHLAYINKLKQIQL